MEKTIILHIPLCFNSLLCARLTASAVCSIMNINIEETEDIKVCVNEACLIFMRYNYKTAKLSFNMDGPLTINMEAEGKCDKPILHDNNEEIGLTLLNSLVDQAEFQRNEDAINSIVLVKRI